MLWVCKYRLLNGGIFMFDFRIIVMPDGTQIIDRNLQTPYNALTHVRMLDYIEVEEQLAFVDRQRRMAQRAQKRRVFKNKMFYKLAHICGIV